MYDLLALYAKPYDPQEPVIAWTKRVNSSWNKPVTPLAASPGHLAREDYEYRRADTRNVFVAIKPKGGRRAVTVTRRRTKPDFVGFVQRLINGAYARARKIDVVLDNLNTHFRGSFERVLGVEVTR